MTSRVENNYIQSLGNTEEWNEARWIDMEIIRSILRLAEQSPDRFKGRAVHDLVMTLPTFGRVNKLL